MIEYIPKEFHNVKLGFYESEENVCTPHFSDSLSKNRSQIVINVPQKVICNKEDSLVIPLCCVYLFSERRVVKYANSSITIIYIKKMGEDIVYQGTVIDLNAKNKHPYRPPNYKEQEERRQQEIKAAQKYSDDELDEEDGFYLGENINVDIVKYVKTSFETGIYEVYVAKSGMESNHVKVEILIKE